MTATGSGRQDGRRVRGDRKRADIMAATLRVVERDGAAGVTHRSVAAEAGVSASSATYYFATVDDLLLAALTTAVDSYVDELQALVAAGRDGIDALAQMIVAAGGVDRSRALAERELTLLAARRPALRPVAQRWRDAVAGVVRTYIDDPETVAMVVGAVDGLCARVLVEDGPVAEEQIARIIRSALHVG